MCCLRFPTFALRGDRASGVAGFRSIQGPYSLLGIDGGYVECRELLVRVWVGRVDAEARKRDAGRPTDVVSESLFDLAPAPRSSSTARSAWFYLREDSPRDIVCIAGGSGTAPMASMSRECSKFPDIFWTKCLKWAWSYILLYATCRRCPYEGQTTPQKLKAEPHRLPE